MSETFTKLFGSITDSTIWAEDNETRIVWVTMLAMADQHGYVGASLPGLAHRARVGLADAERAIEKFLAPDPYSRSQDYEGRRIEVADRGWTLLNYGRFRELRDEEVRKEYERKRKRAQRHRDASQTTGDNAGQSQNVPPCPPPSAQAEAEAEAEADSTTTDLPGETPGSSNGTAVATRRKRSTTVARNVEAVRAQVADVLATWAAEGAEAVTLEKAQRVAGEMAFLYWSHRFGHPRSLLDAKRLKVVTKRLEENGGNVDEILYALDGATRDEYVMGQGKHTQRHDAFEFILRDRGAVEAHAHRVAAWREGKPHPKGRKLAEAMRAPDGGADG